MMEFPYQDEPLQGPAPPSLPLGSTVRWRPLIPAIAASPLGTQRLFARALLDPGADDTVFPLAVATLLGISLRSHTGHGVRWRGQSYALRFGDVELELSDGREVCRWSAVIGFSSAPLVYPILGLSGCLQFFDATYFGDARVVRLEVNSTFSGTVT